MAVVENLMLSIIKSQAEEEFFDSLAVSIAKQAVGDYKKDIQYRELYNFNANSHRVYDNIHTATKSRGCGCILCNSRHEYAKSKMQVIRFKKMYFRDHPNFQALYEWYKCNNMPNITPIEFYDTRLEELKSIVAGARVRYLAAKDCIMDLLKS